MLCFHLFECTTKALYLLPAFVTQYHPRSLYRFIPLSSSFSLWVWHVCLASGGSDLVLLRMMTLPVGLAGHCLTVIHLLQPWGEGRRGGEVKGKKRRGTKTECVWERERDLRERETTVFYGDQSSKPHCLGQLYRIYWTVPHYPAPHPSNCSLFSALFHAPLLFGFQQGKPLAELWRGVKVIPCQQVPFTLTHFTHTGTGSNTHTHTQACTKKIGVNHLQEGL